uniref:Uncharacterized protein n=1 Tax=Globodera rostochiensis TaxID=31243 RepID=A0A914H7T4_GLORO
MTTLSGRTKCAGILPKKQVILKNKMEEIWILILVLLFATNLLDKAESVQLERLEELPLQTFDELFVDEWWDEDEAEDLKMPAPTNFGQNVHHQIDRQNTQLGQNEPNLTDQNPPLTESDHFGQIEPNPTDQNPPITESDYSGQIQPNSTDHSGQIEPNSNDQNAPLIESAHSDNAKNSEEQKEMTSNKNIAENERKQLGVSFRTIYNWKNELGQTTQDHKLYHSKQKELMKRYYEIKDKNPKISDVDIAKMFKIVRSTLFRWKKHFKRQQFYSNSVVGHSVEEDAAANVQEI